MLPGLVPEHRQRRQGAVLAGVEEAPLDHRPAVDGGHVLGAGEGVDGFRQVAAAHRQRVADHRHGVADRPEAGQRLQVVEGHVAPRPALRRMVAAEVHDGGAEGSHLPHHLLLGAQADGEHGDHRGHADDDAEQGQRGAQAVQPHHPPGRAQRLAEVGGEAGAAGLPGAGQVRCGQGLFHRCAAGIGDDPAVENLDDPPRPRCHLAVVGDQDQRVALGGQLVEQRHHLLAAAAVQRAGRFVGEDDAAAVHQRAGDGNPLLLAAGKLVRAIVQAFAEPQALQQFSGAHGAFFGRPAGVEGRHFDVLPRAAGGNQVVTLEDETERLAAQPGQLVAVHIRHVDTGEAVAAGAGAVEAAEQVHQGRFAGTGRADDGDKLAGLDAQRHAMQHRDLRTGAAAVFLANAFQLDQRGLRTHHWNLRGWSSLSSSPSTSVSPSARPSSTSPSRRLRTPTRTSRGWALPPSSTRAR
ncbi:hypothetical protein D9M71_254500 [compost metagenome]